MKYLVVAIAGFVLGGWSVPLGFIVGLGPVATFAAAAIGGLVGLWVFLLVGDRISEWAHRRLEQRNGAPATSTDSTSRTQNADGANGTDDAAREDDAAGEDAANGADDDQSAEAGRVRRFVDRYGVRGLGIVGPIFPGVTASVVGGLALGLDRRALGKWMTIGIIVMYGLYTLGIIVLIELF